MTEQLPPEGRLADDQRARMRAGLMAATEEPVRRARPWVTPAVAAAAVAVVAAGVTVVGLPLGDGDGGDDRQETAPAGQDTSSADEPTEPAPVETTSCDQEVRGVLDGATLVAEHPYGAAGTTYLYGTDTQWVVCDTWTTEDGGPPTITGVHPVDPPLEKALFLVSQNYSTNDGVGAQYFAAGAPIPGVESIQYSFPDGSPADGGHLVDATITDDMWVMQYLLPDPPGRAWTEPVKVGVVFDDGSRRQVFLTNVDLCAQVNHGC